MTQHNILVVEDETSIASFVALYLKNAGYAVKAVGTGGAALNAMVSPWFTRRRPAALGMAYNGASTGGIVFSPLWVALIAAFGFRAAALFVAVAVIVALWTIAGRYFGRDPAAMGLLPDGEAAAMRRTAAVSRPTAAKLLHPWRERRFLTLALASTLALVAQVGLIAHLFSYLVPLLGEGGAGAAMGSVTACAIGGRLLIGWLMPAGADRRLVAAANVGVQLGGAAILLLAGHSAPLLLLGCWLFGSGLGNVTSLPPLIAQAEFSAEDVPRVVALVTAAGQAGYAFAPAGFGLLLGLAGSGTVLFAGALLVQAGAVLALLAGRRREAARRPLPA